MTFKPLFLNSQNEAAIGIMSKTLNIKANNYLKE